MDSEVVHRFLESVGQKADVDLYLKHFRSQTKESFAIIAADAQMVRTALDPFHFDLRILAGVGLYPVVLLGLFDAHDANDNAHRVHEWLVEDAVRARVVIAPPKLDAANIDEIRRTVRANTIPIVSLQSSSDETTKARFDHLATIVRGLGTGKVIFLSPSAGLEREGTPHISDVTLSLDFERYIAKPDLLPERHYTLLQQAKTLLEEVSHRMNIAVVSPLALLRELFTVGGAGTLIRRGARIHQHADLAGINHPRLMGLFESAFGRTVRPNLLGGAMERLFVEDNYLGAALLMRTPVGVYLSKFAVDRTAQGDGIGGDLWNAIVKAYPKFFWRARPSNFIVPWYARRCSGLVRLDDWHVFWCGLSADEIASAIEYARQQSSDFVDDDASAAV